MKKVCRCFKLIKRTFTQNLKVKYLSDKKDAEFEILCNANKAQAVLLFTYVFYLYMFQ